MARGDVGDAASADLSPVIRPRPRDLRVSLTSIVHWADSTPVRRHVMSVVDFPYEDMGMFLVVNQLTYNGAMRPAELVQVLGGTPTNMSKIVGRLVAAGLVMRVAAPDDDRGVLVALTSTGRAIGERIVARAADTLAAALADWPRDDVEALERLLERLARGATAVSEN
jgi:DNA-binding MarR family transcriptional regulator